MASPSYPPINFVLNALSNTITLDISGTLATEMAEDLSVNAIAVFEILDTEVQSVFQFQTDSYKISDIYSNDIKYFVFDSSMSEFNPADAMMDYSSNEYSSSGAIATEQVSNDAPIPSNKMLVCHDYIRYLALKLFGTHHGTDLFNNQIELIEDIRSLCGSDVAGAVWYNVSQALQAVGVNNANLNQTFKGLNYADTDLSGNSNISRELMLQIGQYAPDRFATLTDDSDDIQPVPLIAGDSISFTLTINAAEGQENLTGVAPIAPRVYKIQFVVVSGSTNNTTEAADEELPYVDAPPTPYV